MYCTNILDYFGQQLRHKDILFCLELTWEIRVYFSLQALITSFLTVVIALVAQSGIA